MQNIKLLLLAMLCLFSVAAVTSFASASFFVAPRAQTASVWTTDTDNVKMNQFAVGQTVLVWWNVNPSNSVVDLTVIDSQENVVAGPYLNQAIGTQPISFVPDEQGYYFVLVDGQPVFTIAIASFFVVPEAAVGALAALGAGLATFGIVKLKTKKV
jgi:hypothetical protein